MRRAVALLTFGLTACATPSAPLGPIVGRWGGQHVGLEMSADNGRLDYDCAAGTIDGSLLGDSSGRFTAVGTHTPGTGGPAQAGVVPPSYPALYSGSVRGDTMILAVDVAAINARIGPLALQRGAEPILMRCL